MCLKILKSSKQNSYIKKSFHWITFLNGHLMGALIFLKSSSNTIFPKTFPVDWGFSLHTFKDTSMKGRMLPLYSIVVLQWAWNEASDTMDFQDKSRWQTNRHVFNVTEKSSMRIHNQSIFYFVNFQWGIRNKHWTACV